MARPDSDTVTINRKNNIVDGKFQALKQGDQYCVVQDLARKFKEDAILRLARATNAGKKANQSGTVKRTESDR